MRVLLISLALLTFAVAALGGVSATPAPPLPDLEVLWENPYDYELLYTALASHGYYHTMDLFTLENAGVVKGFECWFFYNYDYPVPFNAAIRHDNNGWPGDGLWTARITDVTNTFTGDEWWGEDDWFEDSGVYHTLLLLEEEDYVLIEAGRPFWLKLQSTDYGAWCCEEGGTAYYNGEIYDLSTFFTILGTPSGGNVESASWGEIKAGFSE